MNENDVARTIVDAAYHIHVDLGPGLLESVYQAVLEQELKSRGVPVSAQVPMPVVYRGVKLDQGYRADLIVADAVIVELKSVEVVLPVHRKQLLTYLRLADKRLGLLVNFGAELMKEGIFRVVNGMKG